MSLSLLAVGLLGAAKIAGGIIAARVVGQGISAIGERIFPYEKTRAYKQTAQSLAGQKKLEEMREDFQRELQAENIQANKEIAMYNRQTQMMLAVTNTYNSLRHTLIQDAIRNFPLNISPLVLLENNHIDISFLMGSRDASVESAESMLKNSLSSKPINVFITPMHVDSRVGGKDVLAAQVYDSVYSSLESVFVQEYSRNSERPVIFYATAWNKNIKAGMHAAEEIFYFLRNMPTIVVEPRFDGKCVKILFSCWGIGYSNGIHSRQEMQIPLDMNSMLAIYAYERSSKALEILEKIENPGKLIQDQINMHRHNVKIFEELDLKNRIASRLAEISQYGHSDELKELGDFSKLMYLSQDDVTGLSDIISSMLGMMISILSDTHHLLANDITPRFPYIYKRYFGEYVNDELLKVFCGIYERTYWKLFAEFPKCIPEKSLEYIGVVQPFKKNFELQDIIYALQYKTGNFRCSDINILLEELKKIVKPSSDSDRLFLTRLYTLLKNSDGDKKYLDMINNILKAIWKQSR